MLSAILASSSGRRGLKSISTQLALPRQLTVMSDDDFAGFDLSEFTEDDFAQIDAGLVSQGLSLVNMTPGPAVAIQIEEPFHHGPENPSGHKSRSPSPVNGKGKGKARTTEGTPFKDHRRNKYLSVSDLASPAWCVLEKFSQMKS